MEITLSPEFRADLLKRIEKREFNERTGVHCSDLIYCLNKQALRALYPQPTKDSDLLLYSLGWSTQRWLTGQDQDEPEKEIDGIKVTLDAIHDGRPFELKCTYQSSNKPIEENMHWIRQIMAQCKVSDSTDAYLTRFEVMGSWKSIFGKKEEKNLPENSKPTLTAYRLLFTQNEIDFNWEWLKQRSTIYLNIRDTKELAPKVLAIPSGQDWECHWCSYQGGRCQL